MWCVPLSDDSSNPGEFTLPSGFVLAIGTDPAEDFIGPFGFRRDMQGQCTGVCFWPKVQHTNGMRTVHGGVLSTMADVSLCALARDVVADAHIVTVSLQVDFVAAAPLGKWLLGTGEVIRRT